MDNLKDIKTIYESPDGGKTVYAREFGSEINTRREIYSNNNLDWHLYLRNNDWDVLAEEHPCIKEALEKLKVMESLCSQ
jgi:hypothetical protein